MRQGKLSSIELKKNVIDVIKHRRSEVISGAALGEDCAEFVGNGKFLISTDPITGNTASIGSLAIKVASNDVIASGGEPFLAMITIIAPVSATADDIKLIMEDAEKEAKTINLEIAGGHTEFSDSVNRMVVSCTVIGKTDKHITATNPNIGDSIIVTKDVGLEGINIIVENLSDKLDLSNEEILEAKNYSNNLSVLKEGRICRDFKVSSMHDITEGGVFGAVSEICEGAGVGAHLYVDKIPVTELSKKVASKVGVDIYRLLSSGSLLVTTSKPKELISLLEKENIKATEIGEIKGKLPYAIYPDGTKEQLSVTPDELFKI
ncbi:MAG TPA: AIR synthase [Clostridiales bacterium]|nr:AIR synthase [Clostridiales bacterium]